MKITLRRPLEKVNKNVPYLIYAGDKKIAELKNGEEKEVEIASNDSLSAKISWCGSKEIIHLAGDETFELKGSVFLNGRLPFLPAILTLLGVVVFNNIGGDLLRIIFVAIMVLMIAALLATITVWRKKWIRIRRV